MKSTFNPLEVEKLKEKEYRDSYVNESIRIGIPYQIRALREQRELTQEQLGKIAGKPRNVISRLENPSSGKPSLQTLLDLAAAFDVALLVKFVPFSRFLGEFNKLFPEYLEVSSFDKDEVLFKREEGGRLTEMENPGKTQNLKLEEVTTAADASKEQLKPSSQPRGRVVNMEDRRYLQKTFQQKSKLEKEYAMPGGH